MHWWVPIQHHTIVMEQSLHAKYTITELRQYAKRYFRAWTASIARIESRYGLYKKKRDTTTTTTAVWFFSCRTAASTWIHNLTRFRSAWKWLWHVLDFQVITQQKAIVDVDETRSAIGTFWIWYRNHESLWWQDVKDHCIRQESAITAARFYNQDDGASVTVQSAAEENMVWFTGQRTYALHCYTTVKLLSRKKKCPTSFAAIFPTIHFYIALVCDIIDIEEGQNLEVYVFALPR